MTRNLCADPAQLLNLRIPKFCHSFYMVITISNSKILLSLHCFLTRQFQAFTTNLLIVIFGVRNPTYFFWRQVETMCQLYLLLLAILLTVLQCYLIWIFVSIRLLQFIVCIGVSTPPQKLQNFFFAKRPLKSANYPRLPFQAIHSRYIGFSCNPLKIGFFS